MFWHGQHWNTSFLQPLWQINVYFWASCVSLLDLHSIKCHRMMTFGMGKVDDDDGLLEVDLQLNPQPQPGQLIGDPVKLSSPRG